VNAQKWSGSGVFRVFGGAHGVTRPSALGSVNMQEGESPSLAELNASN